MKKTSIFLIALLASMSLMAQSWVEGMQDQTVNFYDVQSAFNKYAEGYNKGFFNTKSGNPPGFSQYKRWEAFWEPRVAPSGVRPNPGILWQEVKGANQSNKAGSGATFTGPIGNWTSRGPYDGPTGTGTPGGIGRINAITFHPTNNQIVWAGSPGGGLWKSTDGGQTWSTNTDLLPNLGVSEIAIDPLHPDTMYISTGDRDAGDTYSYGVLKSVDGGLTWNATGLSWNLSSGVRVGGIYINPTNTQVVLVASRNGLWRTVDGGANFTRVQSGSFHTVKGDPNNPNKIFAGKIGGNAQIYLSTDAGATWSQLTTGLPTSGPWRVEIAISPQDSNYIYTSFTNNQSWYGLYRSTDAGQTWSQRSTSPNLMNGSATGNGAGGQGWYDCTLAVSPTNKNQVFIGAVNIWRSNTAGSSGSWTNVSTWYVQQDAHADVHYMQWQPTTNDLFVGTDGGVFKTTNAGMDWTPLYNGMNITQYYKISQSTTNANLMLGGAQDNGTHRLSGTTWSRRRGGDGMDNAIDPDNHNIMYCSTQYGNFTKSTNGGNTFGSMNINGNGNGPWVTQLEIDPTNSSILYAGYDRLYRSTNKGASWSATSGAIAGGSDVDYIAIAPSNNQTIYIAINSSIYRSTNWGQSWNLVKGNLQGNANITSIAVSTTDENHIWITRSSYLNGIKVFESTTGGNTWSNYSGSLPNLPVNCIAYHDGTPDGLYIGNDVGVYYRDATMSDWVNFRQGLPNVVVNDLEIYYAGNKLRAGTFGRGVWESDLITAFLGAPAAEFVASPYATCSIFDTITLIDRSENIPSSWKWSIYPSTYQFVNGTSDSSQNPQVVFSSKDQYTVTLTATNGYGSDTETKTRHIGVGGAELPFLETFENPLHLDSWQIENGDGNITWQASSVTGTTPGNTGMFMDHFNYTGSGQTDALISPPLSLVGYGNINLTFDHAYRRYDNSSSDSLKVYVSTNCGQTWTLLASYGEDGNLSWATAANSTNAFIPTSANDWCGSSASATCKQISLNSYAGNDEVRIKFEAVNDYGNNLYLDNINVTGTPSQKPTADFIGTTNACAVDSVHFADVSSHNPTSWNWSFPGANPATSTAQNPTVLYNAGGTYAVTLISSNVNGSDTIIKTSFITIDQAITPTVSITASQDTICLSESLTITPTVTNPGNNPVYTWYRNGTYESSTSGALVINNALNGDVFDVVLESSLGCITNDSVLSNSVMIMVKPKPNVSFSSFGDVCLADAPITLTGGIPAGGVYSGSGVSNGVFDPSAAGIGNHQITYTYTATNGCSSSAQEYINVNNGPPKPAVTYTNNILKADPISPSYTYQWLDWAKNPIPGATDTVYIPWNTGKYYIELKFLNGCTNVSEAYDVTVVGIDESVLGGGIHVYPNPTKDNINIDFVMTSADEVTTRILDITGRVVYVENDNYNLGPNKNSINISDLPSGTYILELSSDDGSVRERFIKQ